MLLTKLCALFLIVGSVSTLRLIPLYGDGSGILIANISGTEGGVCPDDFTLLEASVVCRELGMGWGKYLRPMRFHRSLTPSMKHVVRLSNCFGNEARMKDCQVVKNPGGVPCQSPLTMGVRCTRSLPDIVADADVTETTSYMMRAPLFTVRCAMEDDCLAPSAVAAFRNASALSLAINYRVLLRFSSIIKNVGTAPFLPVLEKEQWKYHACHRHYHSMADFARYAVLDARGHKVAVGHKSSFCLEDSECHGGVERYFRCGRTPESRGNQGISPGCQDTYFHDYDCQWVDVTDLKRGRYIFQMSVNPNFAVAESNYSNNGIECVLMHYPPESALHRCRYRHPLRLKV